MTIKEVIKITGLSVSKLHYYEQKNLISPERDKNNYRNYLEKDIEQLKYVLILKEIGFSIKDIKKVIEMYVACINRVNRKGEVKDFYSEQIEKMEEKIIQYKQVIELLKGLPIFTDDTYKDNDILPSIEEKNNLINNIYESVVVNKKGE
ncbi:MAG: MerR family transcriptional regulator [Sebaldella sp.]|nr:MerR family transcriptional regulator [Sebaldella sp.]